jgi:hypothetical protein
MIEFPANSRNSKSTSFRVEMSPKPAIELGNQNPFNIPVKIDRGQPTDPGSAGV